jgi:hypothetical protein
MPYQQGTRLPGEAASKLGHLAVIGSEWVRSLVQSFEQSPAAAADDAKTPWVTFDPTAAAPLSRVWAVDGSFVPVTTQEKPPREVAFVKTALMTVDRAKLDAIDKTHPHPLHLKDVMASSGLFHATAFPLKNIRTPLGSNYDAVRHIVRDSIRADEGGAFFDTLKWLAYQKWLPAPSRSPSFECPHCHDNREIELPPDADDGRCPHCAKPVFLTDMIGFHLDMGEDAAPDSVATAYMLVMEHLMLFTPIRLCWESTDRTELSDTLFIKDGPLTLRGQYWKLVPRMRDFLQFAKEQGRPVHVIGQEKTGTFADHLATIARFAPPKERGERPAYAVLSHGYVRREVYRTPNLANPYGFKTNWGEKVYLKLDPGTYLVLNVPTGAYDPSTEFPTAADLIGLDRILATLPGLVSRKHEGALFPIELANGIASMSSYPSAKILERFLEGRRNRSSRDAPASANDARCVTTVNLRRFHPRRGR